MNDTEPNATEGPQRCCSGTFGAVPTGFFKALSDSNRVSILVELAQRAMPTTVGDVASCCDVDLSVVSRHLKLLRESGLLRAERQGRTVRYSVRYDEVVRTLRALADAIEQCCPDGACAPGCPPGGSPDTP